MTDREKPLKKAVNALVLTLTLLYPIIVYYAVQTVAVWQVASGLFVLLLIRLMLRREKQAADYWLGLLAIALCLYAAWQNSAIALRFYPVLINLGLLLWFATSLRFPPTVIERFARLQHPDLPEEGVRYTRNVTKAWCLFFLFNGVLALITAVWGSFELWTLYNGIISYVLMGVLMAIEYRIRLKTQAHVR